MMYRDRLQSFLDKVGEKARISENTYLIILSFAVGVSTGLGAVLFRWLILSFRDIFFGHGIEWLIPLIPMAGGLLVGPIVYFYSSEAKGHGVPEVMSAVALKSGVIRPRVAIAKAVASAICIGSGGSAGREGPIVQIGAAVGSTVGQIFKLSGDRVKILVGCGAAGGISAVFNAPIAGVIFALEIILGDFTIRTFSPVILSSVLASVVSRTILQDAPAFIVPPYELVSAWEIPLYIILGGFAGIVAVIFTKTLYITEDIFDYKLKIPGFLKPALGGLVLGFAGLLAINLNYTGFHQLSAPAIFADGYESISSVLGGEGLWYTMLALVVLKILATNLTLGSGNSGGIFAPSLFAGAMTGGVFGYIVHSLFPGVTAHPGAYALVGMAAVIAGTTHATITSILIVFEMTKDYRIMLALMVACVFSTLIARRLLKASIYTMKLIRQGITLSGGRDVNLLDILRVGEVMRKEYKTIPMHTNLDMIYHYLEESKETTLPVITPGGKLYGMISFQDLRTVLTKHEIDPLIIAADIASRDVISVTENENLSEALEKFGRRDFDLLPVVSRADPSSITGVLYRDDLINYYNKQLMKRMVEREERG
jgi:CIC family chloride channel protein